MYWRFTLDPDLSLATEPGLLRSVHSSDFSQRAGVYANTWRDPVSRLLWLTPSWLTPGYHASMRTLKDFSVQTAGMWQEVTRSPDETGMFTLVHPVGWAYTDVELTSISTNLTTVNASGEDTLYWALTSNWMLAADEGFVVYYHNLTDELLRRANWFALQWGRLFLHIGGGGEYRLYSWDEDTPLTDAPTLRHSGSLCGPGEQMARTGFIAVTPIPGLGITLHFPQVLQAAQQQQGSAEAAVGHGLLIPFPAANTNRNPDEEGPIIGHAGPLTIALNPYTANVLGIQQTRYPTSGTFTDGWFDTGHTYAGAPVGVTATEMPKETTNGLVSVAGALRGPSGAWVTGTDRQGRAQLTLATTNAAYTPFVLGYTVEWAPSYTARGTTPYVVPNVQSIEWSQDALLRNEGEAELIIEGATARAIVERGDATFTLEYSTDDSTYVVAFAGFARDWQLEPQIDASGLWYRARCSLKDLLWKLDEAHVNLQTAFDWRTIANCVDTILRCAGYPTVATPSEELETIYVPGSPTGKSWRYAPNLGDGGLDALDAVLNHAKQQHHEWVLRYDHDLGAWVTEKRAYSTTTGALTLSPYIADRDPDNSVFHYLGLSMRPEPPEANVIQIVGVSDPDSGAQRYISPPCVNQDSIDDETSADFLGRAVLLLGTLGEAPTQREVNLMARRVYDAVAHRRLQATVTMQDWHTAIVPNVYVTLERDGGNAIASLWLKRRTIRITGDTHSLHWPGAGAAAEVIHNYAEAVTLELDSVWESEIDG